jgi:hypothetical protein
MKLFILALLSVSGFSAHAERVTCEYQWKNRNEPKYQFFMSVNALGTDQAKIVTRADVDGNQQMIFGMTKPTEDRLISATVYQLAMENFGMTDSVASPDVHLVIDDGVSSTLEVRLYKNSQFTRGYIKFFCAPDDCGDDHSAYAELKCKVTKK